MLKLQPVAYRWTVFDKKRTTFPTKLCWRRFILLGFKMQQAFLESFKLDADALVRRLCGLISDKQLSAIAGADYGSDHSEHLAELRAIKGAGRVTTIGSWHPHEVLDLIGHSRPDDPTWQPSGVGIDGWMMKAFSKAILTKITADNCGHGTDEIPYHLGGLVQSILKLQSLVACDLRGELAQFSAWVLSQNLSAEDAPFVGLALLVGGLALEPPVSDSAVISICEWISAAEGRLAAETSLKGERWLVGYSGSFRASETWSPIGEHLVELPLKNRGKEAKTFVHTIGAALRG